jgi:hypothetical protein
VGHDNPSHLEAGAIIELRISHDLQWQGCLVFREGAPVTATIGDVHGADIIGKPSFIVLDVQSAVAADGSVVPLSGSIRAEGEDLTMESIGAAAKVCCLAIFIPGGHRSVGRGVGTVALTAAEMKIRCTGN